MEDAGYFAKYNEHTSV